MTFATLFNVCLLQAVCDIYREFRSFDVSDIKSIASLCNINCEHIKSSKLSRSFSSLNLVGWVFCTLAVDWLVTTTKISMLINEAEWAAETYTRLQRYTHHHFRSKVTNLYVHCELDGDFASLTAITDSRSHRLLFIIGVSHFYQLVSGLFGSRYDTQPFTMQGMAMTRHSYNNTTQLVCMQLPAFCRASVEFSPILWHRCISP